MFRKFMGTVALGSLFVGGLAASHVAFAQPDGPRGGGMMAMADANKDGAISKAELTAALEARFAKMDVDKDGKITAQDRAQMRAQRLDARFAMLDADRNGQVSKAEFTAAHEQRAQARAAGGPDGKMRGHHRGMGHDGKMGGKIGGKGRGMMMGGGRMADADKDGSVTRQEFMARPMAMFERADTDRNGTLTSAELQPRAAMREAWQARKGGAPRPGAPTPPPAPRG